MSQKYNQAQSATPKNLHKEGKAANPPRCQFAKSTFLQHEFAFSPRQKWAPTAARGNTHFRHEHRKWILSAPESAKKPWENTQDRHFCKNHVFQAEKCVFTQGKGGPHGSTLSFLKIRGVQKN